MAVNFLYPDYEVARNYDRCIVCRACERQQQSAGNVCVFIHVGHVDNVTDYPGARKPEKAGRFGDLGI